MSKAGLAALALLLLALAWYSSTRPIDFLVYHRVATQILNGDHEIYPQEVYEGAERTDTHTFYYAPVVAWLFVPFGLLPLGAAAFVFACLKIAAYGYTGWIIARRLGVERRFPALTLGALFVVGGYFAEEFRNGNFHAFTVVLMVFAFDRAERGQILAPAASLALAIVAKLTPAALLAYFALRRRFILCAATLAAVGVLWILPAALIGIEANNHLTVGFVRSAASMASEPDNFSLRGALLRTLTAPAVVDPRYPPANIADLSPSVVSMLWIVLVMGIAAACAIILWREPVNEATRLLALSIVLTAIPIVSPHTQRVHFVALFAPAVVLIGLLVRSTAPPRAWLVRAALAVTAAAATILPLVLGSRRLALAYQAFSPYTLATLALLVALFVLTRSDRRVPASRGADTAPAR